MPAALLYQYWFFYFADLGERFFALCTTSFIHSRDMIDYSK